MTAESITSTAHARPAGSPGEGTAGGPHDSGLVPGQTVKEPSTPGHAGASVVHPDNVAAHQLAVALTWAGRGQPVIPCSRTTKRPLVGGFEAGADLAMFRDRRQITEWWGREYDRAHVGLLTRHLLVVDCDMLKPGSRLIGRWADCRDGTEVLAARLAEAGAPWPETYTVLTPSGGMHFVFLQPEVPIGCRTGTGRQDPEADPAPGHIGPLVDVRGDGGYAVAAGSYSARQGRPYERLSPASVRPAPLPAALAELLARPPAAEPPSPPTRPAQRGADRAERYALRALTGAAADVSAAPEREGNRLLFARARRLAELSGTAPAVLTLAAVEEHLVPAAVGRGRGWTEGEALATIRSGWNRGRQ